MFPMGLIFMFVHTEEEGNRRVTEAREGHNKVNKEKQSRKQKLMESKKKVRKTDRE